MNITYLIDSIHGDGESEATTARRLLTTELKKKRSVHYCTNQPIGKRNLEVDRGCQPIYMNRPTISEIADSVSGELS